MILTVKNDVASMWLFGMCKAFLSVGCHFRLSYARSACVVDV